MKMLSMLAALSAMMLAGSAFAGDAGCPLSAKKAEGTEVKAKVADAEQMACCEKVDGKCTEACKKAKAECAAKTKAECAAKTETKAEKPAEKPAETTAAQ